MKPWMVIVGLIAIGLGAYTAVKETSRIVTGISSVIPEKLLEGDGYHAYLKRMIKEDCRTYTLEELKQAYYEECEFKLRYLETFQRILRFLYGKKDANSPS